MREVPQRGGGRENSEISLSPSHLAVTAHSSEGAKALPRQLDILEFDEGSKHMSKGTAKEKRIIALAYFHRYGWIAIMTGLILLIPQYTLLIVSLCFIAISLWSLIGYKLKWKHIYCSHQNAHRKDMTPHHICWTHIKKSEAYGGPLIFLIMGVALFAVMMLC